MYGHLQVHTSLKAVPAISELLGHAVCIVARLIVPSNWKACHKPRHLLTDLLVLVSFAEEVYHHLALNTAIYGLELNIWLSTRPKSKALPSIVN